MWVVQLTIISALSTYSPAAKPSGILIFQELSSSMSASAAQYPSSTELSIQPSSEILTNWRLEGSTELQGPLHLARYSITGPLCDGGLEMAFSIGRAF